jgi:hypothetical protein
MTIPAQSRGKYTANYADMLLIREIPARYWKGFAAELQSKDQFSRRDLSVPKQNIWNNSWEWRGAGDLIVRQKVRRGDGPGAIQSIPIIIINSRPLVQTVP